jgi:hypothetical protein
MRLFTLILSICIVALATVPCSDSLGQHASKTETNLSVSQDNHDHSKHNDDCTPFCSCACCGSIFNIPNSLALIEVRIAISNSYLFPYNSDYSFDYSEGIWHPPSLS